MESEFTSIKLPKIILDSFGIIIILIAYFLNYFNIDLYSKYPKLFKFAVFVTNIILHLPALIKLNNRYGIDYMAYIAQAGCLAASEFRYWHISSM